MSIISFNITVDDLDAVLALYDSIQVWRSPDASGDPTPFSEVTASDSLPAIVDGTVAGPWEINDLVLGVSLSNAETVSIVFEGSDPIDLATALRQINEAIPGLASENDGRLRLTSPLLGTGSSIALSGSAISVLGLSATKVNGRGPRLLLTSPTVTYRFRDYDGILTDYYKTRFYSSKTGAASAFSAVRQGAPQTIISEASLSLATIDLADGAGRPVVGRRIIFVPLGVQSLLQESVSYGILPTADRLIAVTDDRGHAELQLVRGHSFRVFFEGTGYHRDMVVPDQSSFDLLTILSTANDPFTIYQAPPSPIRLS